MEKLNFLKEVGAFFKAVFLHKRMKSLYWTVGAMALPVFGGVLTDTMTQFGIKEAVVVFVGLVIAQITKVLNKKAK